MFRGGAYDLLYPASIRYQRVKKGKTDSVFHNSSFSRLAKVLLFTASIFTRIKDPDRRLAKSRRTCSFICSFVSLAGSHFFFSRLFVLLNTLHLHTHPPGEFSTDAGRCAIYTDF